MKTERLDIETLCPEHAETLFDVLQDDRIYTFIPEPKPASKDALRARYRDLVAGLPPERNELWLNWVLFRREDHTAVGWLQSTVMPIGLTELASKPPLCLPSRVRAPSAALGRSPARLHSRAWPLGRRAEVAYVFFPPHWRQGYATEGLRWMIEHLRTTYDITLAQAEIDTRNAASIALIERLGFTLRETVPTPEGADHVYTRALVPLTRR